MRISHARKSPLLDPPGVEQGWTRVTEADKKIIAKELALRREQSDGFILCTLLRDINGTSMDAKVEASDVEKMRGSLDSMRARTNGEDIAATIHAMNSLGIEEKPALSDMTTMREEYGRRWGKETGFAVERMLADMRSIGVSDDELSSFQIESMERYLEGYRSATTVENVREGMEHPELIHLMRRHGLKVPLTDPDKALMRQTLKTAREEGNGRDIARIHYLISRLDMDEKTPAPPHPLPQLKKYGGKG